MLDAVGKEVSLPVQEIAALTREGGAPLGRRDELIAAIFDNNEVLNGQKQQAPCRIGPGRYRSVARSVASRASTEAACGRACTDRGAIDSGGSERQCSARGGGTCREAARAGATTWNEVATQRKLKAEGRNASGRTDTTLPIELRNALFSPHLRRSRARAYRSVPLGSGDAALLARFPACDRTPPLRPAQDQQNRERGLNARVGTREVTSYMQALRAESKVSEEHGRCFE